MPIIHLEHHSKQVSFGDVPSHYALVGTYFIFIIFSIAASNLGSLEMCTPNIGYCGHLLIHQQSSSWLWVIHKSTLHRSSFSRPHIVSSTVGHKHYRVSLSLDLHLSWLWFIHKPTHHLSPFFRSHTISITVGHKHYKLYLSSNLHLSWLWINYKKPFYLVAFHIQHRLLRRGPFLLNEGWMIWMENGIYPWYSSTHGPYPRYSSTHWIYHGIVSTIHPWYSFTHGIFPWYFMWNQPMVFTYP